MPDEPYDGLGMRVNTGDTRYSTMTGYTSIDTPTNEELYCTFEIDKEGGITFSFQDGYVADQIVQMVLDGAFDGFNLQLKPARKRRLDR